MFNNFQLINLSINFQVHIKMLKEGMKIEARHVRRKQLSKYIDPSFLKRERKTSEVTLDGTQINLTRKRLSAELLQSANSRKRKLNDSVSYLLNKRKLNAIFNSKIAPTV